MTELAVESLGLRHVVLLLMTRELLPVGEHQPAFGTIVAYLVEYGLPGVHAKKVSAHRVSVGPDMLADVAGQHLLAVRLNEVQLALRVGHKKLTADLTLEAQILLDEFRCLVGVPQVSPHSVPAIGHRRAQGTGVPGT